MNFKPAVCGSVLETELLSVYMTSMAVMDTGIAVLKCSFLKYNVACVTNYLILSTQIIPYLGNCHDE